MPMSTNGVVTYSKQIKPTEINPFTGDPIKALHFAILV